MTLFVGCDLGTTGAKAAVVDLDGTILAAAFAAIPLRHPRPGWAEQDLAEIEAAAHLTIRRAVAGSGRASEIAGVALSSQMSGIGAVDDRFDPAVHFDSWLDSRCMPYISEMGRHAELVTRLSGCPPTYSHGPKLLWWQRERPDDFRRIAKFVVPGSYVAGRLVGLAAGDAFIDRTYLHFSNLSDTAAATWSPELLDLFGVDPRVLPRIVDPLAVVGEVTPAAAEATGLPAGTPVAAGAGDTAAAALGAGVVAPGQAFDSAGTASVLAICQERFRPDVAHRTLLCGHSVIADRFTSLAFVNGGGLALPWFRDEFAPDLAGAPDAYRQLDEAARAVAPGADGLLWYPHLQGGVLPPRPAERGGWVGITAGHRRGHLYRSLLEGIAYEYAGWAALAGAGGQPPREARVVGGGAASALWNQIKADVLGIEWLPTVRAEGGVLADALIAAAATGHVTDLATTATAWQRTGPAVRPDPGRHARYRTLRQAYDRLRPQLAPVFAELADVAGPDEPDLPPATT